MKKKLLLLPLLGLTLSGCSVEDLKFWEKRENVPQEENKDQQTPSDTPSGSGDNTPSGGGDTNPPSSGGDTTVHVTEVTLNKSELSLEELKTEKLTYTVLPTNATNKNVEWSTSDGTVASVVDGTITGINPGKATITVTTVDGSKTDTCTVTVTKKVPTVSTVSASLVFNDKNYSGDTVNNYTDTLKIDDNINATFGLGEGSNAPICKKYSKTWSVRMYPGNTLSITSSGPKIREIEFTFNTDSNNSGSATSNPLTSDTPDYSDPKWTGSSGEIEFVAGGTTGFRAISAIKVTYEGEVSPDEEVNLGVKSISEVKEYIAAHPVSLNSFGNGVNEKVNVTIKGYVLAKIDLIKTTSSFGLDVSQPGKIIMADSTGYIGVATATKGDTTFWHKVNDHANEADSKYIVTGYISIYLSHPELVVTSYTWDKTLDISCDVASLSDATIDLEGFYTKAKNVDYNCAGHGYGEVVTVNTLKCYYTESDGSGVRYYNFTDGSKNIRVNAFNLGSVSDGSYYNVTGIISLKNLSPIIVAFDISPVNSPEPYEFDYESVATPITIATLKTIKGSQDDTSTRYPDVVEAFGTIYKTEGYLTLVEENGKYYVGISDNYIERKNLISGKTNAMANYGISLIKNENFWNTTEEELYKYNQAFDQYVLEDEKIEVYYVVRQLDYQKDKALWEILLLPDFLESDIFKVY